MLRFDVYNNGAPAKDIDLSGAYMFAQDSIPLRADLAAHNGQVRCMKRVPGASGLALLWDAGTAGRFLVPTTRLPERGKSYNLNVELARAQMMRIAQKREDWGLFDFPDAELLNAEFRTVRRKYVASPPPWPTRPWPRASRSARRWPCSTRRSSSIAASSPAARTGAPASAA